MKNVRICFCLLLSILLLAFAAVSCGGNGEENWETDPSTSGVDIESTSEEITQATDPTSATSFTPGITSETEANVPRIADGGKDADDGWDSAYAIR